MLGALISGELDFIGVIIYVLSALAVIFLTLPIHEFAHGFIADKLGDPTPRYQGRITLNPFAHIDYIGALCILLFGFGWAKPVQVNSYNFKNPKAGMALTALAGPVSNILVAFIALICANAISLIEITISNYEFIYYVLLFFFYIAQINVYLAVFNLIPVPPLDGSRVLGVVLPNKTYYKIMQYERYLYFGLLFLLASDVLDYPLGLASDAVMGVLDKIAALPFGF